MTKSKFLTRKLAAGAMALALLGVGAGWYVYSDSIEPGAFTDLGPESFARLKNEFNQAAGSVRVIVLLSPT